jgi:hypothetical protein
MFGDLGCKLKDTRWFFLNLYKKYITFNMRHCNILFINSFAHGILYIKYLIRDDTTNKSREQWSWFKRWQQLTQALSNVIATLKIIC